MIKLTSYLISLVLSFLLLTDTEIKTHDRTVLSTPCVIEMEDVSMLEQFNFTDQEFLSDFDFSSEENANQRCWPETDEFGVWAACALIIGCGHTGEEFCGYTCLTNSDGCTVCFICKYGYGDAPPSDSF